MIPVDWPVSAVYVASTMNVCPRNRKSLYRSLRWLLMCLLLLGQTLALAHDHDADTGTESHCALCLLAHHADASLPGHTCGGPWPYTPVLHPPSTRESACGEAWTQYHSRAPPAILL